MAKIKGTVVIERDRCKGCRVCVEACPMRVLDLAAEVNAKGYNYARMVDPDACTVVRAGMSRLLYYGLPAEKSGSLI